MTRQPGGATVSLLCTLAVAAASLAPVGYLFATGVSWADIIAQFQYTATVDALVQTVELTAVIVAMTALLGAGCALLVVRTTMPFPQLSTVLLAVPLAVPGFVSAYAAYALELTYAPDFGFVSSFGGAATVLALSLYPYVFLPCVVALRGIDPMQEEVAASLRPRRAAALWQVVLPALRPALAAGSLIVALHVLAEYGAMVQLGRSTLTTKILAEMIDYGDYRSAGSLSLVLAALAAVVLLATRALAGRSRVAAVERGARRPPRRVALGGFRVPAAVVTLLVPVAAVGPTVFMTLRSLAGPGQAVEIDWAELGEAFSTTLGYACAAAVVATVVALPVSWSVTRYPSLLSHGGERAVWLSHAIPGAILALALVYFATRLTPGLYKTPVVLVAAYVVLFLPLAVAQQRVGLATTRRGYDDVAASLGVRAGGVFLRITVPLAAPGFLAGALLVALDSSKELTTTLMLLPYNAQTLSSQLWATTNGEALDFTAAAPFAALLVVLGIPPTYLLVRHTLQQLAPPSSQHAPRRAPVDVMTPV